MKTYTTLQTRGIEAAKKFLNLKGFEILDENPAQKAIDLVAKTADTICIVTVATRDAAETGFPEEAPARRSLEIAAAEWLAAHENEIPEDVRVRFDSIALMILSGSKAFIRLHTNILGTD